MDSGFVKYNDVCNRIKNIVFGYHNIDERVKNNIFHQISAEADYANKEALDLLKSILNLSDEHIQELEDHRKEHGFDERIEEMINEIVGKSIEQQLKDKTLKKDGYCLKLHLLHKAVQFKHDEDMLGFITDFDEESSRFVFVDFGEAEGPVKIDIEDLIL